MQKKSLAGVSFTGTKGGNVDESRLDPEEHTLGDHYLYGSGEDKEDYSYVVVDADGTLRRGNVDSAWSLGCRGDCPSDETHRRKLRKLGRQFDSNPIPEDDDKTMSDSDDDTAQFRKTFQIKATDDEERLARGVAMEPWAVDYQGDWERPATIRDLSDDYMERLARGEADNGVMHAAFPDENDLSHVENRVLDEPETIGDTEYPAGTWVVGKRVKDDRLWSLVKSGTLSGFSIGGRVTDADVTPLDDLEADVTVPEDLDVPEDAAVREITAGQIEEISLVDAPAVPRAQVQTAKADELAKAADELTAGVGTATTYLVEERDLDPEAAHTLALYLNGEKADEPGSWWGRAKAFFGGDAGGDDGTTADSPSTPAAKTEADAEKAGRTLAAENVQATKAVHDAALDMLERSDVDHGRERFTDDGSDDFDIAAYGSDGKAHELARNESAESDADGGADTDVSMTDTDDNTDKFEALAERLDSIEEKLSDEEEDDQAEEKAGTEVDDTDEPSTEEKVDQLADAVAQMADQVDQMASAQGVSQQTDTGTAAGETDKTWGNSPFAAGGGD